MSHFRKVKEASEGDFLPLAEAIAFYDAEVEEAQSDLVPTGAIEKAALRLPSIMARRYTQLQEVEAILVHVTEAASRLKQRQKQRLLENSRSWTDRQASDFADAADDVYEMRQWVNEVSLVRNKWAGLTKGIEQLHFQLGHVIKLRIAGVEDAVF